MSLREKIAKEMDDILPLEVWDHLRGVRQKGCLDLADAILSISLDDVITILDLVNMWEDGQLRIKEEDNGER